MRETGQKSGCRVAGERDGPNEWKNISLGDVADIQTGPFGSQLHASDYIPVGVPSIMPTNLGSRLEIDRSGDFVSPPFAGRFRCLDWRQA